MDTSEAVRQRVVTLLKGCGAHADFESAVADFPVAQRGRKPPGASHSGWQLLEHLRIAQWDILEFTRDPEHESPPWPDGYWPKESEPKSEAAWQASVDAFLRDAEAMQALVENPETDLTAPLKHGQGQSVLREALLLADHNAYHIGQLVMLRELLGVWKS